MAIKIRISVEHSWLWACTVWVHLIRGKTNVFKWPISDEPIKSLGIKTEYMSRTVVQLVN